MAAAEFSRPTWERWIPVFGPHLDESLANRRAVTRLRSAARRLPGDCLGAIEVRLSPRLPAARAPVDLAIRLERAADARRLPLSAVSPELRSFLRRWGGDIPLAAVPAVWLEYDLGRGRRPAAPVPCLRLAGDLDPDWLADVLVPALRGAPLPPAWRRSVRRCLAGLPPGVQPLYLFDLAPRGADAVRLELFATDPGALVECAGRSAPAAAAGRLARLLPLVERCERFHLALDLGSGVAPTIGLEAAFRRPPARDPGWRELFDRLVAGRLCSPRRAAALLRWPGTDSLWTAARRWPGGGRAGGPRPGGHAVRCLSHVKLVSSPAATEAKAYLLFQHLAGGRPGRRAVSPAPPSR